jgi:hypothetical protein
LLGAGVHNQEPDDGSGGGEGEEDPQLRLDAGE